MSSVLIRAFFLSESRYTDMYNMTWNDMMVKGVFVQSPARPYVMCVCVYVQ